MTIKDLKIKIESGNVPEDSFVFVYGKSRFLIDQYISEIAKIKRLVVSYTNDYSEEQTFFDDIDDGNLYVYVTDKFDLVPKKNYIVITKKSSNEEAIVFPELEQWQLKDYLFSKCSGANSSILDKMLSSYQDAYKLENEMCKLCIFDEAFRQTLSKEFFDNGVFSDIDLVDTFEFINAVQTRNFQKISSLYGKYNKDPMSFIGLMYKQFRNMVNVYLQKMPTEENTGLKFNQIYAIKKVCQSYSKQQILDIFKFLCSLDVKLKSGELPTESLFDYVLIKVLTI
jgi:DNA polymerase III delta subunit